MRNDPVKTRIYRLLAIVIAASAVFAVVGINVRAQSTVGLWDNTPLEQEVLTLYHEQKLITARTKAEELLRRRPRSIVGHYVLGAVLHEAEGILPRARFHLGTAAELYEERFNPPAVEEGVPETFHAELLYHVARLAGQMEEYDYQVEVLAYHDGLYDPDLIGERAWPLMQLGEVDEARRYAKLAIGSRNRWQRSSGLNALCAIEAIARSRQPYYEACKAALEDARADAANRRPGGEEEEETGGITVDAYNAAIAAMSALRYQEAEDFALEGVRRIEFTPANPWRFLAYLYISQGRFDDAMNAMRSMQSWRRRQPAYLRDQAHAENDAALATLLVTGGLSHHALDAINRSIQNPDRRGLTTETGEEARGHHALLRYAVRREFISYLEEASTWGQGEGVMTRAGESVARWADDERITGIMTDEDLLVTTLRPYVSGGISGFTFFLVGDLIEVLGPGVFGVALDMAREEDNAVRELGPHYDALLAELELRRGNTTEALSIAQRVLTLLPSQEVLLSARVAAVAAQAAEAQNNRQLAMSFYEQVIQKDAGTLRRMGLALPASIQSTGGGAASEVAEMLSESPRIDEQSGGFRFSTAPHREGLRSCLHSAQGNEIRCVETFLPPEPEDTDDSEDANAEAGEDEDAPPPLTLAQLHVRDIHAQIFSPQIAISRIDLQSLDGRTTGGTEAVREELQNLFETTISPGTP